MAVRSAGVQRAQIQVQNQVQKQVAMGCRHTIPKSAAVSLVPTCGSDSPVTYRTVLSRQGGGGRGGASYLEEAACLLSVLTDELHGGVTGVFSPLGKTTRLAE